MADFSMSDMPWLGQPADPAGSLARGIQAGSMISQTRNQSGALALRRMEFEEARRERAATLPLELMLKQQESEMNALKIQDFLTSRQRAIANKADIVALRDQVSKAFSETDDPAGTIRMLNIEAIMKNPYLATDPEFKAFSDEVGNLASEASRLIRDQAYIDRNDTAAGRLALDNRREERLDDQFEFAKRKHSEKIPAERLALFNSRAKLIADDITLIGNTAKKIEMLNELAREFSVPMPNTTNAPSGATPGQTLDIGRFKVTPIR